MTGNAHRDRHFGRKEGDLNGIADISAVHVLIICHDIATFTPGHLNIHGVMGHPFHRHQAMRTRLQRRSQNQHGESANPDEAYETDYVVTVLRVDGIVDASPRRFSEA